jgi:hypothetical protein
MGFDTYVNVGDRTVVQYRKQTGDLPRFLFEREDLNIEPLAPAGQPPSDVTFESSAGKVLQVLDEQGLGWNGSVAAYATVRDGWAAEAMLSGRYGAELHASGARDADIDLQVEARIGAQRSSTPEHDLTMLGTVLSSQWLDSSRDEVRLFDQISSDDPVEVSGSMILRAISAAEAAGKDPLPVARAVQTLALLFREARLVAWPMLMAVLLQHLPADTPVRYVLTEGIYEFDMSSVDATKAFVDEYWSGTGSAVADFARNLGVLFGALAAFETRLGPQYWFGQAATALHQLDELNLDRSANTSKARGDALERLMESLLKTEAPELIVTEKNFSTREEEIDLVLRNNLPGAFWVSQHSPYMFVECKNWASPVGVAELRVFESKLGDRGDAVRVGIFVSAAGYYSTFVERLKIIQTKNIGLVYAVTLDDLRGLIDRRERLSDWLLGDGAMRAFDAEVVAE